MRVAEALALPLVEQSHRDLFGRVHSWTMAASADTAQTLMLFSRVARESLRVHKGHCRLFSFRRTKFNLSEDTTIEASGVLRCHNLVVLMSEKDVQRFRSAYATIMYVTVHITRVENAVLAPLMQAIGDPGAIAFIGSADSSRGSPCSNFSCLHFDYGMPRPWP
jgi:hypothetical protein